MTSLLCLLLLAVPPREALLESFDSPADWTPYAGTTAPTAAPRDGGSALRLDCDFTGDLPRAYCDRTVDWDLTPWNRFTLDVFVDDPTLIGHCSFFFRSGEGWYSASLPLETVGWQTISLARSAFGVEGTPAGWNRIDGIRLSPWRGAPRRGFLLFDNLRGFREEIVVVVGTRSLARGNAEWRSIQQYAEGMSELLAGAGIAAGSVTDEEVVAGALAQRKVAIYPYNPDTSVEEAAAVREFMQAGGQVFAFYSTGPLADLLGARNPRHTRPAYDAQFAVARLEPLAIEGLPEAFVNNSWNINAVDPVPGVSVPLAWWHDGEGRRTEYPAMLRSAGGVFMTHVLTSDDAEHKQRLLLALIGDAVPEVWRRTSAVAIAGPSRIGHLDGLEAARAWIAQQAAAGGQARDPRPLLAAEAELRRRAVQADAAGRYTAAVDAAREADETLRDAYLAAIPPKAGEWRALWNHSGTGAHASWAESMRNLHDCGFNAIVPNMLWGGVALYDSKLLPHAAVVAQRGDQITECLAAAKPYGIQVHVWKVNWNLGGAPAEFVEELRAAGRLQVTFGGETTPWLCPSDPRNLELEAGTMLEVARDYAVAGIHFDYIRYPGDESCFCAGCRERFAAATGTRVDDWPAGVRAAELLPRWNEWRRGNITRLVKRVHDEVKAIRPECRISAAVFRDWPNCRNTVAQDWVYWCQQGWLDFVCPMNYTNSDGSFKAMVDNQLQALAGAVPLYPGIGVTASNSTLAPDRTAGQIQLAREAGCAGFILFNYAPGVAGDLLPRLGRGPTAP